MATNICKDKAHPDYDYFNCEGVEQWHITLATIVLILNIIIGILVCLNSIIIYNYSYFNSIRYRCPKSIITWGILTEIYLLSRILYAGILFKWWSDSVALDSFTYFIRGIGLNGSFMMYIIRAWMYYVTYKYDQDLLNNRIATNNSWLFSNKRYKKTIVNEKWLIKMGMVILFILTVIITVCRYYEQDFWSNVYFGITFILVLIVCILVMKFAHDQLGIRIEYATFFTVYIVGFVGTVVLTTNLQDTSRRVLSWLGALVLFFTGNTLTFYFPFIRGGLLKIIRKGRDHSFTKEEQFENHKELALILSNQRTYEAFRTFLASIFCVENIDFFVVVAQYRAAVKAEKLKKFQEENGTPYSSHHKGTTSMFEKVLNPVAKKLLNARNMAMSISKSTSIRGLPKTEDHPSDTRDAAGSVSIRTETMEVNEYAKYKMRLNSELVPDQNGYIGLKASSISTSPNDNIPSGASSMDGNAMNIINGPNKNGMVPSHSPTLSSILPTGLNQKEMNQDGFRLGMGSISQTNTVINNERANDELVMIVNDDDEFYENEEDEKKNINTNQNKAEHLAVKMMDKSIKKVVKSGKDIFKDIKRQKNADDMISNVIVEKDGKKIIDIKSLEFEYLEPNDKLNEMELDKWPNWIYDHYISKKADAVINIAYGSKLQIQQYFESDKFKPLSTSPQSLNSVDSNDINGNNNSPDSGEDATPIPSDGGGVTHESLNSYEIPINFEIFDSAQNEVWKLMANDSLTHFKRTEKYKQLRSFFQTVAPDVDATPRFQIGGGGSAKKDDD